MAIGKYTVELILETPDGEDSPHLEMVEALKPVGARYAAIKKVREEFLELGPFDPLPKGYRFLIRAIYKGHLVNLWTDEVVNAKRRNS